ncbi:MAG: carboxypeptidase-like regulatory domain-containing protein [Cyclobacteriaceae bacterium]|nr:carboxypeptidase-like regulatory domain-containing protein [Cyclobacteriaceae bacterium]
MVKGLIVAADNNDFLVGVHLYAKQAHQGAVSGQSGIFEILVAHQDTLIVTFVGYDRKVIPMAPFADGYGELVIAMKPATIELPGITIYAPPNIDYLKRPARTPMQIPGLQAPAKRPNVGVPIGSTDYGIMSRWGKEPKEKRKLMKVYDEDMSHVVYARTLSSDSVKAVFMHQYDITDKGYNDFIIFFNTRAPLMNRQDPEGIIRMMHQYFLKWKPEPGN